MVVNQGVTTATLLHIQPTVPMGGLLVTSTAWGVCGQPPSTRGEVVVPPGGATWITATFDVLVDCPASRPVRFTVSYTHGGQAGAAHLLAFPDLGDVPYTGCDQHSAAPPPGR